MTLFRVYTMLPDTRTGEIVKGIFDRLFPGLLKEPVKVLVRVPQERPADRRIRDSGGTR